MLVGVLLCQGSLWSAGVRVLPESLEGVVADGHTGGEIELFEFGAKLAEAEAGAVCDLGAAVQVQHFNVPAVLGKRPGKQWNSGEGEGDLLKRSFIEKIRGGSCSGTN